MARIRYSESFFGTGLGGREMSFGHLIFSGYENLTASSTRLRFFDDAANETVFTGTGLTYATDGLGVTGITGGRLTSVRWEIGSENVITVTGLDVSAQAFGRELFSGDSLGMQTILLSGDDDIAGTAMADYIPGGRGDDLILGYQGNDTLIGGRGDDSLTGGRGADVFLFNTAPDAATNVDQITDFSVAADTMQLQNGVFDGLGAAGALGGRYTEGTSATQVNDRIVYDQATGRVYFDEDGLGGTRKVLFAIVDAGTNLTQADFLVI